MESKLGLLGRISNLSFISQYNPTSIFCYSLTFISKNTGIPVEERNSPVISLLECCNDGVNWSPLKETYLVSIKISLYIFHQFLTN